MDVAACDNAEHIADYYLDRRRHGMPLSVGQLRRYTLPLGAGTEVACKVLSSQQVELPTYDYRRYNTRPYRYVYAAGMRQDLPEVAYNQIVKADVRSRVSLSWFQDGCAPAWRRNAPRPRRPAPPGPQAPSAWRASSAPKPAMRGSDQGRAGDPDPGKPPSPAGVGTW